MQYITGNEVADKEAKKALLDLCDYKEYICVDENIHCVFHKNEKIDCNLRIWLKDCNLRKRDEVFKSRNPQSKSLLYELNTSQIFHFKKMMASFKSVFNSNFRREDLIKYTLKGITTILPTKTKLKEWKLDENEKCIVCGQIETTDHILGAVCCKEFLNNKITQKIDKFNTTEISKNMKEWIKCFLMERWETNSAFSVLDPELILKFNNEKLPERIFIYVSKLCLKIGFRIW